jgi:hypothetical protein
MDTYKIILTCDVGNELQELPLGQVLAFDAVLGHRGGKALVAELVRVREVAIHGFSYKDASLLVERIRQFGARCAIERDECATCRSPMTRVLSDWQTWLSPQQRALISSGRAIVGPNDGMANPDCVCLTCFPEWRDVHQLALELEEGQRAKEEAIAVQDFDRARLLRDQQYELRPRFEALLERLRS